MTLVKRTQGRPPRSSGINGRDKLIEATRIYLQSNRKMSLTRTEIAQGCGVTPALISYYFKDKKSLLDAVTKPLVRVYRQQLSAALSADGTAENKMRRVIRLLLDLNRENAFLVDYTLRDIASQQVEAEDRAVIDVFHDAIAGLSAELVTLGVWHSPDIMMTEVALWGMCRAFGEMMRVKTEADTGPDVLAAALDHKVDFIFRSIASRPVLACAK